MRALFDAALGMLNQQLNVTPAELAANVGIVM